MCLGLIMMALRSPKYFIFKEQNIRFIGFQALAAKFVLALEPTVLKLEGSFCGILCNSTTSLLKQ